jgi:hypothetical protein
LEIIGNKIEKSMLSILINWLSKNNLSIPKFKNIDLIKKEWHILNIDNKYLKNYYIC